MITKEVNWLQLPPNGLREVQDDCSPTLRASEDSPQEGGAAQRLGAS